MPSSPMQVAALGRPFSLGMLYDAHTDKLHAGFTLWDEKTIQENSNEIDQHSSSFQVTASDSIKSKSDLLSIEASLKASFLSGLIEVGRSAKYLNDRKKFKSQSRVTLQYKATTNYQHFSISHHEAKNIQAGIPKTIRATHVVTGILYGANAFFVFDSEKLEANSVHDFEDHMQAVINKIPKVDVDAKVDIKLTIEEKALTQKFSCKFYGDFILESNPATFDAAVKAYANLPKMLREKGQKGVPLKVTLTPLKNFDFMAEELKGQICKGLLRKAQDALEDISETEMRCNDSLEDEVLKNFPQISKTLRNFHSLCNDYRAVLRRNMEKKFPAIRAGKEDDASVEKLFDDKEKSPFSQSNLSKWMEGKEREINIIRSCVEIMEATQIKMIKDQSELEREVLAPGVDHVLCYVFTSLESDDPYLQQMEEYLHSCDTESAKNVTPSTQEQWCSSQEVLTSMREKANTLRDLAKALKSSSRFLFLAAAVPNSKYKGATIYHYRGGKLSPEVFSQPNIPDVTKVTERGDLIWYACDLTLDPDTASDWLTLSEDNKKATCGDWQYYTDLPERFNPRPQVLCREELHGRHYWEVEWSKCYYNEVGVAVTYQGIEKKGKDKNSGLGCNAISWYFGEKDSRLSAWNDGEVWSGPVPSTGCHRVGVYLDWAAGTLSFYSVSSNTLNHLYTFRTRFTEPVYPGFWVYNKTNYVGLSPM